MMFPIRCMTCGKPIAHLWDEYKAKIEKGEEPGKVLDSLGIKRYCCRSIFLTHTDLIDKLGRFIK